jgi:hypothetical protein
MSLAQMNRVLLYFFEQLTLLQGMANKAHTQSYTIDQQSHFSISQTVNDTIALHSSPMRRLADLGSDALTQIDALTLLLDASDSTLAGQLLAEYGSLTGLARVRRSS